MKVIQINCSASGSTGNIAKAIHKELLKSGDTSYIFYELGVPTEENMFRIGNYFGLHAHAVLSRNLGRQGYFSRFSTLRLVNRLKKIKPDIIHLHNLHGSYLNLPMLFKYLKKSGVQVVLTLHDCWLFTGKCPHFTVVGCYKWKAECGGCPQLAIYPGSKRDTTRKSLADKKKWLTGFDDKLHIVAVSNWLRDTAKESYLNQYSVETIYNGVDTTFFRPCGGKTVREKYGLGEKFVILGVAANWSERKGLNEFIRLSKEISEDEIIVLVGLSREQIAAMPPNIIGITKTENKEELARIYSAADIFVNTSKEETFGLVTAEAMACGTSVIAYNSTACGEIVDDKSGYVIWDNDGEQMIKYIRQEKKNRLNVKTVYSDKTMTDGYLDLYRRINRGS